jgi:hypothetical protein
MTTYGVVEKLAVMAKDVDSLNRFAQSASDLSNGNVVQLLTKSTDAGEGEVWVATAPATSSLNNLYMVAELGTVTIYGPDGTEYVGINSDPRNFYVKAGKTFSAFKLKVGDLIRFNNSDQVFAGTKSTNTYVNPTNAAFTLTWGATATASATSLKLVTDTDYISIGSGTLGATGRVTAYTFQVVAE